MCKKPMFVQYKRKDPKEKPLKISYKKVQKENLKKISYKRKGLKGKPRFSFLLINHKKMKNNYI